MHMADSLLSPAVGGIMWIASAGLIAVAAKKITTEDEPEKTPLMGIMGAFIFATQMINFTIPGTGASGHLGGGLLLTILLGPWRAFLTMASVLTIQCLMFADGGLLALGCNIFNLAFFPSFIAYPFIYRPIVGNSTSPARCGFGAIIAGVVSLQLGAFAVVLETTFSGITELPFAIFALFMQSIHLAIGIVEGAVTFGVVSYFTKVSIRARSTFTSTERRIPRTMLLSLVVVTLFTGGILAWFASSQPDGLEWSTEKASGKNELAVPEGRLHRLMATAQQKTALLPDYHYRTKASATEPDEITAESPLSAGTSFSGIIGSLIVLSVATGAGLLLRKKTVAVHS